MYLEDGKSELPSEKRANVHGQAALAFAKSINHLALGTFKGGMVDVPLALAEGFRNTPRLWGQTVKDHEEVVGWKSGVVVAGKIRINRTPRKRACV